MAQFYSWFKMSFPLLLGMVIYDNEFETKEHKFKPRIKLNHNISSDAGCKESQFYSLPFGQVVANMY